VTTRESEEREETSFYSLKVQNLRFGLDIKEPGCGLSVKFKNQLRTMGQGGGLLQHGLPPEKTLGLHFSPST
jgi:hypothetical protein